MATTSIPNLNLPESLQAQLLTTENLPALVLAHHRATFHANVANGTARYFVFPYSLLGSTIVPIIYLTIPHKNRPWLYQARWAVAAVMVALSVDLMTNGTSSANVVVSYSTGLVACWGLIWGLTILLVLDPQFEAARVMKRRRRKNLEKVGGGRNGAGNNECQGKEVAIDESVALLQDEYEHYWQYYPSEGTFMERLGWVLDLTVALRGVGWNFAPSTVPHPQQPPPRSSADSEYPPVNLSSTPVTSRIGTIRHRTYLSFTLNRLANIAIGLLIIDLCTLIARRDPYFALGPNYPPSTLPPFLASLPPQTLSLLRSLTSFIALLAGLNFYLCLYQLLSCLLFTCVFPKSWSSSYCANELWQYPEPFGPFVLNVLDGGIAGFWGGFWHQTFRIGFVAPVTYLDKQGYLSGMSKQGKQILGMASAFTLSASIHAAGAYTSIPDTTQISAPFLFFGGSFLGIMLEQLVPRFFSRQVERMPRWLRRMANLIFVALWLHITGKSTFLDDMSGAGLFLFEPIPFSPLRWLGVMDSGLKGDGNWWRWDGEYLLRWVPGREGRWWEAGFRL
ncbi:hypothetical protein V8F20_000691 [Naviculisporaceae sp. PSN 640]